MAEPSTYRGDSLEGMAARSEMKLNHRKTRTDGRSLIQLPGAMKFLVPLPCHPAVPTLQLQWPQEAQAFPGLRASREVFLLRVSSVVVS